MSSLEMQSIVFAPVSSERGWSTARSTIFNPQSVSRPWTGMSDWFVWGANNWSQIGLVRSMRWQTAFCSYVAAKRHLFRGLPWWSTVDIRSTEQRTLIIIQVGAVLSTHVTGRDNFGRQRKANIVESGQEEHLGFIRGGMSCIISDDGVERDLNRQFEYIQITCWV
jgi:hypothetical protein